MLSVKSVLIAFVSILVAWAPGFGQDFLSGSSIQERVDRGEQLILEVAAQRKLLPARWACTIEFAVESTPEAESFILINGRGFVAYDGALDTKVKCIAKSDSQADADGLASWDTIQIDWERKKEHIVYDDGSWVAFQPGQYREHLDPFILFMANSNVLERGISEDMFDMAFFGIRSCLGSSLRKSNIETVWGPGKQDNRPGSAWFILHDEKTGLPVDFQSKFYDMWDPQALGNKSRLLQKSTTKWGTTKKLGSFVPLEVQANWMNNDEALEATFVLSWLFEDQVGNSTFVDPRNEELKIPGFEIPRQQKKD